MTPHPSAPCACRATRIPYATGSVALGNETHRATNCTLPRIELKPAFVPPAPRLLSTTCSHGEALWVTGPEPEALLAERGCGCEVAA
jgi:hypothetical protein